MTHRSDIFPHFFIVGAQKAGTTSLCAMLDATAGVSLARPKEPMLLSRDDIAQHPHFFAEQPHAWKAYDWDDNSDAIIHEYQRYFEHAKEGDLRGDGSTSYLSSHTAPQRIRHVRPDAKIIAILRDPAKRAYSAYWHYVKTGNATESFAKHLQFECSLTVTEGDYVTSIKRWLSHFSRSQCLFLCYEEMLATPEETLKRVCSHLGVTPPERAELPKKNPAKTPRIPTLQLALNYLYRRLGRSSSAIVHPDGNASHWLDVALNPLQQWNLVEHPYPPMSKALHHRLDMYYARINAELESLTGLDVASHWYTTLA